jgi:glycosyltransferase involved in cell wall biosynthesis
MRVAVDARELQGRVTGVGRYLGELLACWSRDPTAADVTITLCAPERVDIPSRLLGSGGAQVESTAVPGAAGTLWEQTSLPRAIRGRSDVLFAPGYSAPLFSPVPTVLTIHDLSFFAHPEWFRTREGLRRRWTTKLAALRASRILTVSEFSRAEIVRLLRVAPERVTVTPEGSGGRLSGPHTTARPNRPRTVLYVGSILNRRQLPELVRAFAPIARRDPAARLVIVGENRTFPFEDPAVTAREEGIAPQVDLRAYVCDAELADLYGRASVFAFLSTYEGFGLTPLEAMGAGVPVVACDTPVAREVYGDAALLVPIGSRDAITRALESAMGDSGVRARLDAAARVRLQQLSWERTASLTLQALRHSSGRP